MDESWLTTSLCPMCLKRIDAQLVHEDHAWYLHKECPEHGLTRTILWKGSIPMELWIRTKKKATIKVPNTMVTEQGCPFDCGLCSQHRQHTCTALIEVTKRCNLSCTYCFASSHTTRETDPSLEIIKHQYTSILNHSGMCNIQLSGGEPTLRDDLPEIIRLGKELGFEFIQVNTNGIRLAEDKNYVARLKEAGLSSVFLQFDGIKDETYQQLRGRGLASIKMKAIEHCKEYHIGVVLVPTLVPGVNVDQIGEIIKYGINEAPTVRGVHFQPVSFFGRIPFVPHDAQRITLPEVMDEICRQMKDIITLDMLLPPGCENALCSFHGNFSFDGKRLLSSSKEKKSECCTTQTAEEGAIKAKNFVRKRWVVEKKVSLAKTVEVSNHSDWDRILEQITKQSFSISGMAFQDVWNINLERVKDCCIHVSTQEGNLIPFCLYNVTSATGDSLYREVLE